MILCRLTHAVHGFQGYTLLYISLLDVDQLLLQVNIFGGFVVETSICTSKFSVLDGFSSHSYCWGQDVGI